MRYTKRWLALAAVLLASFAILGYYGVETYQQAPPIPRRVVTSGRQVIFTHQQIQEGRNLWQSMGGQQVGSIWGHEAYVAPDWSADWLHREIVWMLNHLAQQQCRVSYAELSPEQQTPLRERVKLEIRTSTYHPQAGDLVVSPLRARAIRAVAAHYAALFGDEVRLDSLSQAYAIPPNSVSDARHREALNAFFFGAAWSCGANRPGSNVTYTNNWPHEPLIDNQPTSAIVLWSIVSVVALLAGVGAMVWYFAARRHDEGESMVPEENPLRGLQLTPSMRATLKYFQRYHRHDHHLYFTGTPTVVLARGATFSALEVVPLVLVGYEAYGNQRLSTVRPRVQAFQLPILFFVGVAFWNMLGAGLFGFLINPPIALYYMQGLNTTPVHGHTALFGMYGLLGLGLILFCFTMHREWDTRALLFTFWAMNIELSLVVLLSLLPIGLLQAAASIDQGLWYARFAEFLQQPLLPTLRWMRTIGDSVFTLGALALAWFVAGVHTGWSLRPVEEQVPPRESHLVFHK